MEEVNYKSFTNEQIAMARRVDATAEALYDENERLKVDILLLKEQCRVGDVAFQHLFCESKGKPLPDWVKDGLPNMYKLLAENERLKVELNREKVLAEVNRNTAENGDRVFTKLIMDGIGLPYEPDVKKRVKLILDGIADLKAANETLSADWSTAYKILSTENEQLKKKIEHLEASIRGPTPKLNPELLNIDIDKHLLNKQLSHESIQTLKDTGAIKADANSCPHCGKPECAGLMVYACSVTQVK